jgi:23S rRNA (cytosine1962-C5)-methyltransferase
MPEITVLSSSHWTDYELLDSGDGQKLERFGAYRFVRPEHQAIWRRSLSQGDWNQAHAVFQPAGGEEMGGRWLFHKNVPPAWQMTYSRLGLKFQAQMSTSRHLGMFPEQAVHWDWMTDICRVGECPAGHAVSILNLFGYTGLASLAAAAAGARVTHVDASKKSVGWAKQNQMLSGLNERPIRWMVDDALKFVQREARRGAQYDGIVLDPPKFGRGPKGEVWDCFEMLPVLLSECSKILSTTPRFIILTAYAIRASALSLYYALEDQMRGFQGQVTAGELVSMEKSSGRGLSQAIWARWESAA